MRKGGSKLFVWYSTIFFVPRHKLFNGKCKYRPPTLEYEIQNLLRYGETGENQSLPKESYCYKGFEVCTQPSQGFHSTHLPQAARVTKIHCRIIIKRSSYCEIQHLKLNLGGQTYKVWSNLAAEVKPSELMFADSVENIMLTNTRKTSFWWAIFVVVFHFIIFSHLSVDKLANGVQMESPECPSIFDPATSIAGNCTAY